MKSWKKENRMMMKVWYSLDKYKESEEYLESVQTLEGEVYYVNTPHAGSFLSLRDKDGNITSISRELVLKIEWQKLPKWAVLSEKQVVDSAKLRMRNLDNEISQSIEHLDNEKRLKEELDKDRGSA
jgi:hypothetical protein|tara:strand:- start:103 stop:480 length:378 start_codon:yes stop_codon:yes gene_type:complete